MVLPKTEAVWANGGPRVVAPDLDQGDGTIECSSSFGATSSGFGGEVDGGEPEVNSVFSAHASGGGSSKLPRRKKVTAEWRNSVGPVLWRCQWLELRMKELSSQVSKYDRELALIKKQKEILQQKVSKANGSLSYSMQIHKGHENSIMKRRKRKRHEENADAPLYIYKHQILSYYHDKQNKGVTGDLLIDDDCGSVDGNIRGGLDAAALLDSENYDTIFEQLTLKGTLVTIDGLQSRVHLLQDRLSKVLSGGANLALSEDNTHVRVPWKRQHTQTRSFSSTKCQYTKPQKMKNLNIFLKDDGSTLPGRPAFPDRETEAHIKDANRNAEERSGECNHSREKSVIVDLLLGTANFIPNCHIGDLCKNTDDILIDNQAANEVCQQFDDAKRLPSGTSSRGQNISGPAEMKSTCAPVEVNNTCPPVVEPVPPQIKRELKPKKRMKKGSFFTKKQRKEASKTHAAKKIEDTSSAAKNKTGSTLSAVAAEKTERKPSGASAMGPGTMVACSAGDKRKTGNEPADKKHESLAPKKQKTVKLSSAAKKQETVKLSSAAKKQESVKLSSSANKQETVKLSSSANKQETVKLSSSANKKKTENPSSAGKKQKTENPSSAAKNQETENAPATKETESAPLNLKTEKTVLVAVNSRRSQRVRKPKVFAE